MDLEITVTNPVNFVRIPIRLVGFLFINFFDTNLFPRKEIQPSFLIKKKIVSLYLIQFPKRNDFNHRYGSETLR